MDGSVLVTWTLIIQLTSYVGFKVDGIDTRLDCEGTKIEVLKQYANASVVCVPVRRRKEER